MIYRSLCLGLLLLPTWLFAISPNCIVVSKSNDALPSKALTQQIDSMIFQMGNMSGLLVGVVAGKNRLMISCGVIAKGSQTRPNATTSWHVSSVSKMLSMIIAMLQEKWHVTALLKKCLAGKMQLSTANKLLTNELLKHDWRFQLHSNSGNSLMQFMQDKLSLLQKKNTDRDNQTAWISGFNTWVMLIPNQHIGIFTISSKPDLMAVDSLRMLQQQVIAATT